MRDTSRQEDPPNRSNSGHALLYQVYREASEPGPGAGDAVKEELMGGKDAEDTSADTGQEV